MQAAVSDAVWHRGSIVSDKRTKLADLDDGNELKIVASCKRGVDREGDASRITIVDL